MDRGRDGPDVCDGCGDGIEGEEKASRRVEGRSWTVLAHLNAKC